VTLCTGRRHRTSFPAIQALGLTGPAVVQNGVVIKDGPSGQTLERRGLDGGVYEEAVRAYRRVGSPLVFVDEAHTDFFYEAFDPSSGTHDFQAEYLNDHGASGTQVETLSERPSDAVVMISCMADTVGLTALRSQLATALDGRAITHQIQNKNYRGEILEVVSPQSGKWAGIQWVCEREGIDPRDVMAIGDDHNDAEMIERAGLGIAMGNAVDAVKDVADVVGATNADDGVVRAIEKYAL
jgi:HAD superfamily hydrolase (TIGR01484 family)